MMFLSLIKAQHETYSDLLKKWIITFLCMFSYRFLVFFHETPRKCVRKWKSCSFNQKCKFCRLHYSFPFTICEKEGKFIRESRFFQSQQQPYLVDFSCKEEIQTREKFFYVFSLSFSWRWFIIRNLVLTFFFILAAHELPFIHHNLHPQPGCEFNFLPKNMKKLFPLSISFSSRFIVSSCV